jgi:hypothetical protein
VDGVGGGHRGAPGVQEAALRTVERLSKEKDAEEGLRLNCANVLRALGSCGGAYLWANGLAGYEAARPLCLAGLEDRSHVVRSAFAGALAMVVAAAAADTAVESVRAAGSKPRQQQAQQKALAAVLTQCLVVPLTEAIVASNHVACTALAQAWVAYLSAIRTGEGSGASRIDELAFLDVALKVVEALSAACAAAGSAQERSRVAGEGELGMGVGGGERPHAQASWGPGRESMRGAGGRGGLCLRVMPVIAVIAWLGRGS